MESKWGNIKHDVSKFIGVYVQDQKVRRSGKSMADTLRLVHKLFKQKTNKGMDFTYEYYWILLYDHPKWTYRWTQVKPPTPKRMVPYLEGESNCIDLAASIEKGGGTGSEARGTTEIVRVFKGRLRGHQSHKRRSKASKGERGHNSCTSYSDQNNGNNSNVQGNPD